MNSLGLGVLLAGLGVLILGLCNSCVLPPGARLLWLVDSNVTHWTSFTFEALSLLTCLKSIMSLTFLCLWKRLAKEKRDRQDHVSRTRTQGLVRQPRPTRWDLVPHLHVSSVSYPYWTGLPEFRLLCELVGHGDNDGDILPFTESQVANCRWSRRWWCIACVNGAQWVSMYAFTWYWDVWGWLEW